MKLTTISGWPGCIAHELTHALAAAPFAETRITWRAARPYTELVWDPDTPRAAVRLAHLAPTILGVLCTAAGVLMVASMGSVGVPSNPFFAAAVALLVGYNWLLYCYPSRSDRRPFEERGESW